MPTPKIETVQPAETSLLKTNSTTNVETNVKKSDPPALKSIVSGSNPATASTAASAEEYQAINDRLNNIEKLISDLMVKVDDKTRSIERSVAKVKSSKSKHVKPQSVTICVDSPALPSSGKNDGNNCDEQFL